MTTDGSVLASGNDAGKAGPSDIVGLERSVSEEIQDKIRMTLAPYLGLDNFRSSVTVKLNTDRHQINETKFDPDSKVERSVRVTKETGSVRDTGDAWQTTVEQNIPSSTANAPSQKVSSQDNQRRDETTTYEISSTTTAVESNGYAIDALSVAVVINRQALLQGLGGKAAPEAITAQVQEIQNLVSTAAGLKSQRGDTVKIMTVDFQPAANQIEPAAALGIGAFLADRAGLLVNATTMLIIAALVTMLGIRPATRMLLQRPEVEGRSIAPAPQRPLIAGSAPVDEALLAAPAIENAAPAAANLAGGARGLPVQSAQRRLQQLVESNEEGAAGILRDWIREATPQ
jgi:flagellar M-ring protein FliF